LPLTNLHKKICASEDSSNYEIGEICKSRRAGYAIVICCRNFVKDYSESYFKMLDVKNYFQRISIVLWVYCIKQNVW